MQRIFTLEVCNNKKINGRLYIFPIRENDVNVGLLVVDYTDKEYNDGFFKFIDDIINK